MRIIKKIVVQMALLGIMSFAAPSIWDGSADVSWYEESAWTYNITTAEQLAGLAKLVNEGVSDFKGKKITLGADIFLNDTTGAGAGTWNDKPHRSWTPIGTESRPSSRQFKGEFDGYAFRKNRKIYGLYYNDSKKNYIGIFGSTSGATISNVDLLVGSVSAGDNVGALIGSSSDSSLIKNVHSEIYVVGRNFVGGLVGYHLGNIFNSSVQGSVVGQDSVGGLAGVVIGSVDVSFHNGGDVSGRSYVGGLVGVVEKDSISQAYADGRVIGKGDYIGGLVGFVKRIGKIIDSYHIGGNVEGASYVGGLIGSGFVIYRSHADGYVIGTGDYVGGLAGAVESEIKDSYHIGGNVEGAGYVGGLVGYSGRILQSYADGYVIGTDDYVGGLAGAVRGDIFRSYHTGDVDGASYVGGLVGKFEQKQVTSDIDRSYAEGRVTGRKNYVGGLAGVLLELYPFSDDSYVANSEYAYDVVQYSYFIGNVKGVNYVGGAIGLDSIYHGSFKNGVRIIRSIKNINVQGDVVGKTYVGGIVGKMNREKYNASIRSIIDSCDYRGGDVSGVSYVGGVLGYNGDSYCILKNSVAKGNVLGLEMYVGGLAGYAEKIDSCYHTEGRVEGKSYVGGLVGRGSSVLSSHAGGNVTGVDDYVGGLAGFVEAEISDSYHTEGNVEGKSYVGGLVGYSRSISQSYADGMVRGANDVGGLAGYATSIFNSYARANYVEGIDSVGGVVGSVYHIEESFFNGDSVVGNSEVGGLAGYAESIVDSSYSTACVKGISNVGGLIGGANGNVSNSYALGDVAGDVENLSTEKGGLGGLVGYQYNGSIRKSMAKGNVSGTINLGGLVGCFYGTEITSSYANGNVAARYYSDSTDGVGKGFIGGLVGRAKVVTVDESYVSGSIKGSDWIHGGCLVGFAEGSLRIEKSYYDSSKCYYYIGSIGDSTSKIGSMLEEPKRSTSAMKSGLPFGDYTYTWKRLKNSYPHLFIYANSLTNADVEIKSFATKYDGFPKIPIVQSVSLFGNTLKYESDYTVDYEYKENVGVVSIKVCGVKSFLGYSGCKFIDFEMSSAMVKPTIAAIENKIYTGKALTPEISVYYGETLLDPAFYSVEYMNNVQVSTANVIVTMKNRFKTTVSTTFKIEMAACEIPKQIVASGKMIVASDIVIGEPLAFSKISSDYNVIFSGENVDGNYVWKNPNTRPTSKNGYEVVFVPKFDTRCKSSEIVIPINVLSVYAAVHVGDFTLDSVFVAEESNYILPKAPDSIGYDFWGFYNGKKFVGKPGDTIAVNEDMILDAVYQIKKYEVTFKNGADILQTNDVAYGSTPVYNGSIPTKASTGKCNYTFKNWDPTLVSVTEPATYTAVFDSSFIIVFRNGETKLQSGFVAYGSKPQYTGKTPTKASAKYVYTFKGWYPIIESVTDSATYIAVFDSTLRDYAVTFKVGTKTLQKKYVDYGVKPSYTGDTPTKASTEKYTYTFKGWNPSIVTVTDSATYTAVFDSTLRKYTITFKNGTTTLQTSEVAYGTKPSYTGSTPTKKATNKYTYKFKGWNPAIATVTKAATYQAVFDSSKVTGIIEGRLASSGVAVRVVSRSVQISAAPKNSTYAILDMQGRVLLSGRVESENFNIAMSRTGSYLVRVGNATRKVQVK